MIHYFERQVNKNNSHSIYYFFHNHMQIILYNKSQVCNSLYFSTGNDFLKLSRNLICYIDFQKRLLRVGFLCLLRVFVYQAKTPMYICMCSFYCSILFTTALKQLVLGILNSTANKINQMLLLFIIL